MESHFQLSLSGEDVSQRSQALREGECGGETEVRTLRWEDLGGGNTHVEAFQ